MGNLILIGEVFIILILAIGLWLAFWVLLTNRKSRLNQIFFLMNIFILLWVAFSFLYGLPNQNQNALLWIKLNFGMVSLFFVSAYFFSQYFPKEEKRYLILDKLVLIIGTFLYFISLFTNFIVKDVKFEKWGTDIVFGGGENIFLGIIIFLTLLIITLLFKKYFKLSFEEKLKTQYFLIGILLFASFNLIFNVIVPRIRGTIEYYQLGDYSVIFFIGFTAYAIVKQNLFGIRVVLTTFFVGLIAVLLFIDTAVLTKDFNLQLIKGLTLIIFLFFGYSLIRSVLREIKLREELETAYAELQKLDKAKSEFISIASHQLRTPLAAMKGYISMIIEENYGPVSTQIKTKLQNVFLSNERLIKMVNDLLSVSRIESGRVELNIQKMPIEDIVIEVVDILKLPAKNKKLQLIWEKPMKLLPKALIDPDKTREIILNIVDNAIKYTQKGNVKITTEAKPGFVLVKIADTGTGLSEEEISKMFKSFSRGSAGQQFFTEGMGLGLYIAKQFTEMQRGKIWAESLGRDKGSTFFIELPTK